MKGYVYILECSNGQYYTGSTNEAKLQTEIERLQTRIDYCEDRINKIAYQLYGLTDEEIKIVEGRNNA